MSLTDRIAAARTRLRDGSLPNEASVSSGVVLPILDALGWPVFDPAVVCPEYKVEGRRVDFALLTHGQPAVFVEVKQPGLAGRADRQLFEYAFHEGVPLAILTDGTTWHVYVPALQGSYDDRRVYLLDLLEREPAESADRLRRYLAREAVESGDAEERARADYKRSRQRRGAEAALPQAWANLAAERGRLADLLAAEVESVSGYQPDAGDVAAFLASLRPTAGALPPPSATVHEPGSELARAAPAPPVPPSERSAPGAWTGKGVTLPAGSRLRGSHRGAEKRAVIEDGSVVFEGASYRSPSGAGVAATGRSTNGWTFWEVKRPGDARWRRLDSLRP